MVKLIMGLKGAGKTKQLINDINEAVKNETIRKEIRVDFDENPLYAY